MEIIGSAILVLAIFFYLDNQSKIKKLEKRVADLEREIGNSEND